MRKVSERNCYKALSRGAIEKWCQEAGYEIIGLRAPMEGEMYILHGAGGHPTLQRAWTNFDDLIEANWVLVVEKRLGPV